MPIGIDRNLEFQQLTLNLRAQRQQIIASNIANADTPNYKARDMDFDKALSQAVAGRRGPDGVGLNATAAGHIGGGNTGNATGPVKYRTPLQPSIDGNTVDMDVERAAFAENAMRFEAGMTFISRALRERLDALQNIR